MSDSFDLSGKVALVTGASSGIGRATVEALAASGARVAINFHRNEAGAEAVRSQITAVGGHAIVVKADVTRASEVQSLVEQTVAEFGPIDILVNNAGSLVERLKILELTEERGKSYRSESQERFSLLSSGSSFNDGAQGGCNHQRFFDRGTQWRSARLDPLLHGQGWCDHLYQRSG